MLTWPSSSRTGALPLDNHAGYFFFSQLTKIPDEPTLPDAFRTYNLGRSSGLLDWARRAPWRAPGSAPVLGSGCGTSGGNEKAMANGGDAALGYPPGSDGLELPSVEAVVWPVGTEQEVAWRIKANHGGGYSYRLCRIEDGVSEACFQRTSLRFAGDKQWLRPTNGSASIELPLVTTREGTYPEGSEWARNPIPVCSLCDVLTQCGPEVAPNMSDGRRSGETTYYGGEAWEEYTLCWNECGGLEPHTGTTTGVCDPGAEAFPPPVPGLSGIFGLAVTSVELVDRVEVPADLLPGRYLLSWRLDCEESFQVWENCADIQVVASDMAAAV